MEDEYEIRNRECGGKCPHIDRRHWGTISNKQRDSHTNATKLRGVKIRPAHLIVNITGEKVQICHNFFEGLS